MPAARPTLRLVAVSATLALALTACGKDATSSRHASTDEAKIRQTVINWYSAVAHADGARLCALLTPAARDASATAGPSVVIEDGKVRKIPATCAARTARQARLSVVEKGIAPSVSGAAVRKVDVLGDHANARTRLGRGEQIMALPSSARGGLSAGFRSDDRAVPAQPEPGDR